MSLHLPRLALMLLTDEKSLEVKLLWNKDIYWYKKVSHDPIWDYFYPEDQNVVTSINIEETHKGKCVHTY